MDASQQSDQQPSSYAVEADSSGKRLDVYLTEQIATVSRVQIKRSIESGVCLVNGKREKASYKVAQGDKIKFALSTPQPTGPEPEPIELDILFEDDAIVVVNKPAGMVVHPAKGHWAGTLASALAHRFQNLSTIGGETRPGIVHRLDRDTTGAIIVAKTDGAHRHLSQQFQDRTVKKEYLAIVMGRPDRDRDRIEFPIGPHPSSREKMALRADHPDSRAAETFYEVLERYPGFSLVRAEPKTGRTHQIRLHMVRAGHPILCDKLYGGRSRLTLGELRMLVRAKHLRDELKTETVLLDRQALHAHRLRLTHPISGEAMSFEAPLPGDMAELQKILQETSETR